MKKIISFSMLLLALTLVFVSCNREDDNTSSSIKNYIQVDSGTKSQISLAGVTGYKAQDSSEKNEYEITFISTDGSSAKNVMLSVEFPYNQLIDGTYNLTSSSRVLSKSGTTYQEVSGNSSQIYSNLSSGTCTVKRNSTKNFTISFSIKPSNGKVISGEYSGDVTLLEI